MTVKLHQLAEQQAFTSFPFNKNQLSLNRFFNCFRHYCFICCFHVVIYFIFVHLIFNAWEFHKIATKSDEYIHSPEGMVCFGASDPMTFALTPPQNRCVSGFRRLSSRGVRLLIWLSEIPCALCCFCAQFTSDKLHMRRQRVWLCGCEALCTVVAACPDRKG